MRVFPIAFIQTVRERALFRSRATTAGFNLIEVTIATLVVGIFVCAILVSVTSGYSVLEKSRETLRANQILQQELETVRTYSWTSMTNSANFGSTNYADSGVSFAVTRSVSNYYNSTSYCTSYMREVTISIAWTNSAGSPMNKDMSTVVSEGGLNDYIY